MEQLLVVSTPGAWPARWDLRPMAVRGVVNIDHRDTLAGVDCVAIVPETEPQVVAAVRAVEEVRRDNPLAMVLASNSNLPNAETLIWQHEFDGFIDLEWPAELARMAVCTAMRHVQLGRNVVNIQRVVLEHARNETASLFEMAAHDDLTGLFNRRHFAELMAREHERSERSGHPYALVFIDLDDLKHFNTRYGHAGGSKALRELADIVSSLLRGSDVAARVGGDEFVVFLADTREVGAMAFAARLLRRLQHHRFEVAGESASITVSVGIATYPQGGDAYLEVLNRADQALFYAKSTGKNRVVSADA